MRGRERRPAPPAARERPTRRGTCDLATWGGEYMGGGREKARSLEQGTCGIDPARFGVGLKA